jgi:dolichyl-phosphate-mannose-protein mannosyltransferase
MYGPSRVNKMLGRTWRLFSDHYILVLATVAMLILHLVVAGSSWGAYDSDVAVTPLMAQAAAHGHFYAFYWGQNYGGTAAVVVEAPFVWLFGLHIVIFRIIDVAFLLIDALLLRSIVARLFNSLTADVASALILIFPPSWFRFTSLEYEFWLTSIGFALFATFCMVKWYQQRSTHWLFWAGVGCGLTLWTYELTMTLLIPILVGVVIVLRRDIQRILILVVGAVVGAIPFIYSNATRSFLTFHDQVTSTSSAITRFGGAGVRNLPTMLLTYIHFANNLKVLDALGVLVFLVAVLSTIHHGRLALQAVSASSAGAPLAESDQVHLALALVGCAVLLWPFVLVASGVPDSGNTYRYAFVLLVPLSTLVAYFVTRVRHLGTVAVVAALAVTAVAAFNSTSHFASVNETAAYRPIATYLQRLHRTHVFASYWISYQFSLAVNQDVTASPVPGSPGRTGIRDPQYQALASAQSKTTYVVFTGEKLDGILSNWLDEHKDGTSTQLEYVTVYSFNRRVLPSSIPHFYGSY